MFHVHSSCISNTKNIKGNIQPKEVSVVNTELSLKVRRVMLMIFSIDLLQFETQHLHFKVFLTIYMHQFGWLSERGGNFLNLLQKEGVSRKGGVFPQKRKEIQPWRKLCMNKSLPLLFELFFKISFMIMKIFSLLFSYFPTSKLTALLYIALRYIYFILLFGKIFHFLKPKT